MNSLLKFMILVSILTGCSSLKKNENSNTFHADVVLIKTSNSVVSKDDLLKEFEVAQNTFSSIGVNLNLLNFKEIEITKAWHKIYVDELRGPPSTHIDFYDEMDISKVTLSKAAVKIFGKILENEKNKEKTIFVITINDVYMTFYDNENHNKKVDFRVGAFSFPSYLYANRIPKDLRGVITTRNAKQERRTLAHELGHKLINVSHEGGPIGPQFSGNDIPGLMGYGNSLEIMSGEEGRWHKERLLKSPYLYKIQDGNKKWNPDYENSGIYRDTIYKGLIINSPKGR